MENTKTITILCLLASVMIAPFAIAESPTVLLKQGIYVEEIEGDLDKAIEIYKQVLKQAAEIQRLASRATYQLGMCHLKKGEKEQAAKCTLFRTLLVRVPSGGSIHCKNSEFLSFVFKSCQSLSSHR